VDQGDILIGALDKQHDAIFPAVSVLLAKTFPDSAVLETDDHYFVFFQSWKKFEEWDVLEADEPFLKSLVSHHWWPKKDTSYTRPYGGWFRVRWQSHEIRILGVSLFEGHCRGIRWYVIASNEQIAQGFFAAVCRYHSTVRGEILVLQEGRWHPDEDLYASVKGSSLDDIVLHGNLKNEIVTDIRLFFEQEETYRKFRIPWKRGMLFLGPPGNGKTHMLKAIVNSFSYPCLYVKSFRAQYSSPHACVSIAFERAREVTPCFLKTSTR